MKRTRIRRSVIRSLRSGDRIPDGVPKCYPSSHGYVRLRWLVGPQQYVEVYEHRVVNGVVTNAEHVHHDNRVKSDNSVGNLVPLTAEEHNALHAEERQAGQYAPYRSRAAKEKAERAERKRSERRARADEMRRLYLDEKLTVVEIADRVGLHHSGVSRELRATGVRLRASRGAKQTGPLSAVRGAVTARARLRCERCDVSVKWVAHHVHHRRPRGMGGSTEPDTNTPVNLLLLCTSCHDWVESNRTLAYAQGLLVHRRHDPESTPVQLAGRGLVLLTASGGYLPYTEEEAS